MAKQVVISTEDPTVAVIGEMRLKRPGVNQMAEWVEKHRPECLPDDDDRMEALFPHDLKREDGATLTDNELLVELAGRKCYDSFGLKAGRKSNAEYILHTQAGDVPHASIMYHAKISCFFGGISRRVSHELIRNYVGSDRDEEGSPSQESTRFTHHYGWFVLPPKYIGDDEQTAAFTAAMQRAYDDYTASIERDAAAFTALHGTAPKGLDRKRIYEASAGHLPQQAETSFIWTSNPVAIAKFARERDNESADLEMIRFARKYARTVVKRYPNLFPQPWMQQYRS